MTARRRLTATVSAGFALLVLTACEKPAPIVTVVSSGQSEWAEANRFCFEGQSIQEGNCAVRGKGADVPTELEVEAGQPIAIDVSKEVAERGWRFQTGEGNTEWSQVFEEDHYRQLGALGPGQRVLLTVQTVDESGQVPTGEWRFLLITEA